MSADGTNRKTIGVVNGRLNDIHIYSEELEDKGQWVLFIQIKPLSYHSILGGIIFYLCISWGCMTIVISKMVALFLFAVIQMR